MGRTKKALTAAQRSALEEVRRTYAAYEARREEERPRAWEWVMEEIDRRAQTEKSKLETALRAALEAGIPKRMIQTPEILGSTSQAKVAKLLGAPTSKRGAAAVPMFTWLDDETARVVIPSFDTLSAATDYPDQLAGVVRRDLTMPGGWAALTDESDEGNLPGHLRWELDQEMNERHLGILLDALATKARS